MFKGKSNQEPDFEYFSIYDSKVGHYREPILSVNRFDLLRQIQMDMVDPKFAKSPVFYNAEDFQLFKIGEFNKKTGEITPCKPEHVANLHEIKSAALRSQPQPERQAQELGIIPT